MSFSFLRKGRTCLRRQINSFLGAITRSTNWHAWLGEEYGFYLSNDKPKPVGVCAIFLGWRWFTSKHAFGIRVRLADSVEDTIAWTISIPWLVEFRGSLDITGWLRSTMIRKITEQYVQRCYGFRVNRKGFGVRWHWGERLPNTLPVFQKGWEFNYTWQQLNGKPVITTNAESPLLITIIQPGTHGFSDSKHEVLAIVSQTTWRWPRFWKSSITTSQVELKVDNPPAIVPGGHALINPESIYGYCARDTLNIKDAIKGYQQAIIQLRAQHVSWRPVYGKGLTTRPASMV